MSTMWQCWAKRSTRATTQAAPGKTVPQCLKDKFVVRVVVPTARCFSSDSYGGSVTTRSTELDASVRSHATASRLESENRERVFTLPLYAGSPDLLT